MSQFYSSCITQEFWSSRSLQSWCASWHQGRYWDFWGLCAEWAANIHADKARPGLFRQLAFFFPTRIFGFICFANKTKESLSGNTRGQANNAGLLWPPKLNKNYSEEHNDVWMTHCLHGVAFTEKISQWNISVLNFELFHDYLNLAPTCTVYHSIPAFIYLGLKLKLFPRDLGIWVEFAKLRDSTDLKLRCSLYLLILLSGRLIFLEKSHVDCFQELIVCQ